MGCCLRGVHVLTFIVCEYSAVIIWKLKRKHRQTHTISGSYTSSKSNALTETCREKPALDLENHQSAQLNNRKATYFATEHIWLPNSKFILWNFSVVILLFTVTRCRFEIKWFKFNLKKYFCRFSNQINFGMPCLAKRPKAGECHDPLPVR